MMEIHLMKATSAPWLLEFSDFKADNGTAEGLGDSLFPEGKDGISRHILIEQNSTQHLRM